MAGLKTLVFGMLLGGGASFISMQYHVVRTEEGPILIPRSHQPPLRSAYLDIREWGPDNWQNYPEVSEAVLKAGKGELIVNSSLNSVPSAVTKPASASSADLTKQALEALVPIRFTSPDPNPPRQETDVLPSTSAMQQNIFAPRRVSGSQPSGLPVLEHPVPIAKEQPIAVAANKVVPASEPSYSEQPRKSNWMNSLLQAMIPGGTGANQPVPPPMDSSASADPVGNDPIGWPVDRSPSSLK